MKPYGISLLAIASFAVIFAVWLNRGYVGSPSDLGARTMAPGAQTDIVRFNLLGPDWAEIPKGYTGLIPDKVVAELHIPEEYVAHSTKLHGDQSSKKAVEEIPIDTDRVGGQTFLENVL